MDEIKRYDIGTEQTGYGIYGIRIDEENDGDWCKYEDVMEKFKKAKLKSDNSEYAKCSEEIFNKFLYNHDLSYKNKIESIIKKHFA